MGLALIKNAKNNLSKCYTTLYNGCVIEDAKKKKEKPKLLLCIDIDRIYGGLPYPQYKSCDWNWIILKGMIPWQANS